MEKTEFKKYHNFLVERFKFIVILEVILIFCLGFLFLLRPLRTLFSQELTPEGLRAKIDNRGHYLTRLLEIKDDFEKIDQEQIKKIEKMIPPRVDILNFLIFLEGLAKENGLVVTSVNFKTDQGVTPNTIELGFGLSGGNYQIFKNFLQALEKNLRIIHTLMPTFSLEDVSYQFNIKTYFMPPFAQEEIEPISLEKIKIFITSKRFLQLREKKDFVIDVKTIKTGRPNPFLPF